MFTNMGMPSDVSLPWNSTTHSGAPSTSCREKLMEWVEWFEFPIKFLTKITIPDMNIPQLQKWYPLAFVMSMTWLAIFAFLVVSTCDLIHEDFGISTGLLGFTVAAAGTSFPNVFSGMVVSRNGKTTMALANALGANVQNVFLALAVPWTVQSWFINHGPIAMEVQDLQTQVAMIYITLLPVILVYVCYRGTMPKWSGGLFLVTYFIYLGVAIMGDQSGWRARTGTICGFQLRASLQFGSARRLGGSAN